MKIESFFSLALVTTLISPLAVFAADSRPDLHQYKSYEYTEANKTIRLTIPEGLRVVRGILVVGPHNGGDSREMYREVWYREFMHLHSFAFLGAQSFSSHAENYWIMRRGLKQFAVDAKHPELINAPYVTTGFSAGGGYASRLVVEDPEKVIAAVIVGSRLNLTNVKSTAAHFGTPVCIINGEQEDRGMAVVVEPVLAENRPKGALWGWMAVPGIGHGRDGQEVLAMPMLDAAVRMRYPVDGDVQKGALKLKPIELNTGWIADNGSWRSGLTKIATAEEFRGDLAQSSWLLNEDIAFIYRAYATYDRPLKITSPSHTSALREVWDEGSSVEIVVDDSGFTNWKTLTLYDGASKLAELNSGAARFTVKDLRAGYHAFSVLGTGGNGDIRPSNPVLVVVRKEAAASSSRK